MLGPIGSEVTVSVAPLLVTLLTSFVTTQSNAEPLSPKVAAGVVYVVPVAPEMFTLFFRHWYVNGNVPVAATLNVAVCPSVTV